MSSEPVQRPDALGARDPAEPVALHMATGAALRDARLHRGLTIAEAATDTKINPAYLDAMEAERWELLPAPVYARGFLRSYARYLRFDAEAIEQMVPRNLPRPRDLEPAPGLRRSSSPPGLALPSFAWLRREPRLPVAERARAAPRVATPRSAGPPRSSPFARTTGAAGSGTANVSARVEALLARGQRVALEAAGHVASEPLQGFAVVGASVLLVFIAGYLWFGRTTDPVTSVGATATATAGTSRQAAGPEPATNSTVPSGSVAPPREGEMPDLLGLTRREAEDELGRLELAFVVIEVATPASPPGTVYNQSPQAGKAVKRGDSVTLLVARAP